MDSVSTGHISFRWDGKQLIVTTPAGQYPVDGEQAQNLLIMLYDNRQAVYAAARELNWAAPDALPAQRQISAPGSIDGVVIYEEGKE